MWIILAIVVIILVILGVIHFVRRQIASSREQLKHVDRSKLKDLDKDAWAQDERDDNKP